jgi:hypothetical protein
MILIIGLKRKSNSKQMDNNTISSPTITEEQEQEEEKGER